MSKGKLLPLRKKWTCKENFKSCQEILIRRELSEDVLLQEDQKVSTENLALAEQN